MEEKNHNCGTHGCIEEYHMKVKFIFLKFRQTKRVILTEAKLPLNIQLNVLYSEKDQLSFLTMMAVKPLEKPNNWALGCGPLQSFF